MKKSFKSLICAVLSVLLMFSLACTAFAASDHLSVTASKTEVKPGDQIIFTISITKGQEGCSGAQGDVKVSGPVEFTKVERDALYSAGSANESGFSIVANSTADGKDKNLTISYIYTVLSTATDGAEITFTVSNLLATDSKVDGKGFALDIEGLDGTATASVTVKVKVDAPATEPTPPTVDKTALNAAIAEAEKVDETEYTAESYAKLKAALDAARKVAAKADATKAEVNKAVEDLAAATKALEPKETEPSEGDDEPSGWWPGQDYQPGTSSKPTTPSTTTPEKDEVPKTGDASMQVWPLAVMMVLSAAGVAVLVRKRNGK